MWERDALKASRTQQRLWDGGCSSLSSKILKIYKLAKNKGCLDVFFFSFFIKKPAHSSCYTNLGHWKAGAHFLARVPLLRLITVATADFQGQPVKDPFSVACWPCCHCKVVVVELVSLWKGEMVKTLSIAADENGTSLGAIYLFTEMDYTTNTPEI